MRNLEHPRKDRVATEDQIRTVLEAEHDYLYWIALLITGNAILANKCLVDTNGLPGTCGGVFHDWLSRWAHSATARISARTMHEAIVAITAQYESFACEHTNHELLSEDEVEFIRQLDPRQVIAQLDPLCRTVLVLRGIQGASISDCALLLELPRRCVLVAYCRALHWLYERADVLKVLRASEQRLEIFDGEK